MVSDYLIKKELIVEYIDNILYKNMESIIEIDNKECYFNDNIEIEKNLNYDSDDSDDSEIEYKFDYLKIYHIPRIIYENGNWRNLHLKYKYENLVCEEIINFFDVTKITKVEKRLLK